MMGYLAHHKIFHRCKCESLHSFVSSSPSSDSILLSRYLSHLYLRSRATTLFCHTRSTPLRRKTRFLTTNIKSISSVFLSLPMYAFVIKYAKRKIGNPAANIQKQRKRPPDPHPETPFIARSLEPQNDSIVMSRSVETRDP